MRTDQRINEISGRMARTMVRSRAIPLSEGRNREAYAIMGVSESHSMIR